MGMAGWHAMAEGVADGVNGLREFDGQADWSSTLMTYHTHGNHRASMWFHDAPWLGFNGAQIGWEEGVLLKAIDADYARQPPKPIVNIEPWYEQCTWKQSPVDDWEVRVQAYQTIFAGACGHTYGHTWIYAFDSPPRAGKAADWCRKRWREALSAPGRMQMQHLRQLMESQTLVGRVPLPQLVIRPAADPGPSTSLTERVAATGGADGTWAFVYSPRGDSFSIDTTRLRGPRVVAHWFDPRSGELKSLGDARRTSSQTFDPPGAPGPGNDWILTLTSPEP